jgi:hypothetical protein
MTFNPLMRHVPQELLRHRHHHHHHHHEQHGKKPASQSPAAGPMGGTGRSVAFAASPQPVGGRPRVPPASIQRAQVPQPQHNNDTVGLFPTASRPYNWIVNLVAGKALAVT